jgi:hypothetical protein
MLELAEIFYLRQQFALATEAYGDYVRLVGDKNQSAHGLWIGIRIARANGDNMSKQVLVNQLRALFPIAKNINVICNYSTVLRPYGSKSKFTAIDGYISNPNTLGNVQRPGEYLRQIRIAQKRELADVSKALNMPIKTLSARK